MPGAKKKRVSKKTKQSWRKHVDIKDVEEYLEDKRTDERLGTFELLPDKALFKVDTKPYDEAQLSKKEKRKQLLDSTPRCFQILQPLTKVPDPITKRNRVRTPEERKCKIRKSIEENRRLQGIVKAKDKLAAQNRALHRARKEANKFQIGDFKNDLWDVQDVTSNDELKNEWYTNDTIRHTHQGLGKLRKRIPASVTKKNSILPTVELPHPGMSYNPSFKDHQALLKEIADKELKIIKEEKHIERVTTKMFKKVPEETRDKSWLVEMSEGLPSQPQDDQSDSDSEFKAINPPVKNVKKDRKQKRKQREQQALLQARRRAKIEKKKVTDVYKLKQFNEQIEKTNKAISKMREKREKVKQYKLLEPKRLSSKKFEAPELEFNMGQDISGNLRGIKSEGNLLADRFKSMQKRNILEVTVKQPPKKRAKVKKFEKATHKMGWETKGY